MDASDAQEPNRRRRLFLEQRKERHQIEMAARELKREVLEMGSLDEKQPESVHQQRAKRRLPKKSNVAKEIEKKVKHEGEKKNGKKLKRRARKAEATLSESKEEN